MKWIATHRAYQEKLGRYIYLKPTEESDYFQISWEPVINNLNYILTIFTAEFITGHGFGPIIKIEPKAFNYKDVILLLD